MTQKQTSNSTASSVFVMGARKRLLAFLLDGVLATMMVLLIPFDALNERLPSSLSSGWPPPSGFRIYCGSWQRLGPFSS